MRAISLFRLNLKISRPGLSGHLRTAVRPLSAMIIPTPAATHDELLQAFPDYKLSHRNELDEKYDNAISDMRRTLEIFETVMGRDSHYALHANLKLSNLYRLNGDNVKAMSTLKDNIASKNKFESCLGYQSIAQIKILEGDMDGALKDVNSSIEAISSIKIEDSVDKEPLKNAVNFNLHISFGIKGICCYYLDDFAGAKQSFTDAIVLGSRSGVLASQLTSFNNLGALLFHSELVGNDSYAVSGRRLIWRLAQYTDQIPLVGATKSSTALITKSDKEKLITYDNEEDAKKTTDRSDLGESCVNGWSVAKGAREALNEWDVGSMTRKQSSNDQETGGDPKMSLGLTFDRSAKSTVDLDASQINQWFQLSENSTHLDVFRRNKNWHYCQVYSTLIANCSEALESLGEYKLMEEAIKKALLAVNDFSFEERNRAAAGIRPLMLRGSSVYHMKDPIVSEGLYRAAGDLTKSKSAKRDLRYRYDSIILKVAYGKLLTKWMKREEEGRRMVEEAVAELKSLPRFANDKVFLTNAFVFPLQL